MRVHTLAYLPNPPTNTYPSLLPCQVFKTLFEVGAWRAACANASSNVKAITKTFKEVRVCGTRRIVTVLRF